VDDYELPDEFLKPAHFNHLVKQGHWVGIPLEQEVVKPQVI
jgi:hypothetical protein